MRTAVLALVALAVVSCSSVMPVRVDAGDVCYRCRRAIVESRLAGEVIAGTFVEKFRAPGCMAKYLKAHPEEQTAAVFVTDYTTGKMIPPRDAVFLPVVLDRNTGERDYRAYKTRAAADAASLETHTTPVAWHEVLEAAQP